MTSYRWKARLFLFNVSCCVAAAYFFRRHNKFCEAGGECQSPALSLQDDSAQVFTSCLSVLQSTPCSPSSSTWWSSPTWPSTWRPSGTLAAKRWSWPRRLKTNDTEERPHLWTFQKKVKRNPPDWKWSKLCDVSEHTKASRSLSNMMWELRD